MSDTTTRRSPDAALAERRRDFGNTCASWANARFEMEEHRWTAFSGAPQPDYNLVLVHGGDVHEQVRQSMADIKDLGSPALMMLAGAGLSGAQVLADAGWVSLHAIPLMHRGIVTKEPVESVRQITSDRVEECQKIAAAAFGIGPELAAVIYRSETLERPDVSVAGYFVDDELVSCGLLSRSGAISTGWALATHPDHRRAGYASYVIDGAKYYDALRHGPSEDLCLSSPSGLPLYTALGFVTLEHWQVWSRPRWVLGAS